MMFVTRSRDWPRKLFYNAFLGSILILFLVQCSVKADEVPAFFLKIAKNIPRVGRSEKFEDFYSKSTNNNPNSEKYYDNSKSWQSHENSEHFAKPLKRRLDYSLMDQSYSWQNFPLAIEGPRELWRTLAGYSKDPSEDMSNEIWTRKKRTGEEVSD
ncbi:PREDICTED: uncharacterized protein LOC107066685 [Polistes dominula]|uniref:Uncharacterized protein LOC107066685 n=1 Tax=Polistes dominula TaxID=743375 RepID=A0ABM1I9X5_POLDO|nr:PREDICTED: uncharacterized protein LOC107066685 [Polistes dominula]